MTEATITVRIPQDLKDAVDAACKIDGMTLSGFVRNALQDKLAPSARVYELPGLSQQAAQFFASLQMGAEILLLLVDRQGRRFYAHGNYLSQFSSDTLIIYAPIGRRESAPALRRDVVAWFTGTNSSIMGLIQTLARAGWQPFPT
jgi:hypothetical protein